MTPTDALFHGEIMFWVVAFILVVIGGFNNHLLPVWADVAVIGGVITCTSTARKLKAVRVEEDA